MEKYCDTNLNHYIKIKLTEEGRIIYKKYYNSHNCEAPKLDIDDEGYVRFQIHDFMHIFGERLFMGATLPCETNCKIQVKDEWHYVKDGDLPKDENRVWLCFGVDDYNDGQFIRGRFWCGSCGWFDADEVIAWKEIVPPQIKEE